MDKKAKLITENPELLLYLEVNCTLLFWEALN